MIVKKCGLSKRPLGWRTDHVSCLFGLGVGLGQVELHPHIEHALGLLAQQACNTVTHTRVISHRGKTGED